MGGLSRELGIGCHSEAFCAIGGARELPTKFGAFPPIARETRHRNYSRRWSANLCASAIMTAKHPGAFRLPGRNEAHEGMRTRAQRRRIRATGHCRAARGFGCLRAIGPRNMRTILRRPPKARCLAHFLRRRRGNAQDHWAQQRKRVGALRAVPCPQAHAESMCITAGRNKPRLCGLALIVGLPQRIRS